MPSTADIPVHEIAREIEAYLRAHPGAGDSAQGIWSWWLDHRSRDTAPENVQRALDELVARGVMLETLLPDGRMLYTSAAHPRPSR